MLKKKELLKSLIETQKQINESLKSLKEDLKPQLSTMKINGEKLATCNITVNKLDNYIETNVYNKEQTINAINKECDYREQFKECDEKNPALLNLIEDYCKFENKYEIIDLFRRIDRQYEVKSREDK